MSYKTYITEAIVCGSKHHNTSDKNYLLFSKDAGMVWVSARSVREERSKQRYSLQDFSLVRVSLVKGKSGWRVGSVESYGNAFLRAQSRIERGYVNYLVAQLRRYVHGETPLPRVYEDVIGVLQDKDGFDAQSDLLQRLFSVRLLSELGYVAVRTAWKPVIEATTVKDAIAAYTQDMEAGIIAAIKEGTEASHL